MKRYDCVVCGNREELYKSIKVDDLLKIKPNLKNCLWSDMRINKLKKSVRLCRFCYLDFLKLSGKLKELEQEKLKLINEAQK